MPVTLVLCALPYESELLKSFLKKGKGIRIRPLKYPCFRGYLGKREVYVIVSGPGKYFYENTFARLLKKHPFAEVIFFGTAGQVNPLKKCGDVVIADQGISWSWREDETIAADLVYGAVSTKIDSGAVERRFGQYHFNVYKGCIVTWCEPVFDPKLKSLLYSKYKADGVDMESGYGVRICEAKGIPFMVVRAISDTAGPGEENHVINDRMKAVIHSSFLVSEILTFEGSLAEWMTSI
jgi:adenosylhomocysteine nucleosidase